MIQIAEVLSDNTLPQMTDDEETVNVSDQQTDGMTVAEEGSNRDAISELIALAIEQGGVWTETRWVERTDPVVPAEILGAAFRRPKTQDQAMSQRVFLTGGDQAVFTVFGLRGGNEDSLSLNEQEQLKNQLGQQIATYELTSYVGEVRQQATVRIPEAIINPPLF